jgi:phosphoglycolate phosphatase-like HAD superfamily hydrolase
VKNILIDLDNTILDSNKAHLSAFDLALKQSQIYLQIDYSVIKGLSTRDALISIGVDVELISKIASLKSHIYKSYIENGKVKLFPDSLKSLKKLNTPNYNLRICTAASQSSIDTLVQRQLLEFKRESIFTTEKIGYSKLNAKYWHRILEILNSPVGSIIVIDDSTDVLNTCNSIGLDKLIHVRCDGKCDKNFTCVPDLFSVIELLEGGCWY